MNATVTNESVREASEAEVERYEEAYRETRRVLDESIETLAILEELELDRDLRKQLKLERRKLEDDRSALVSANNAFHAKGASMNPPSPELVAEIVALSKKVVEITVERAEAQAVILLATSALDKFKQIQDIGT